MGGLDESSSHGLLNQASIYISAPLESLEGAVERNRASILKSSRVALNIPWESTETGFRHPCQCLIS